VFPLPHPRSVHRLVFDVYEVDLRAGEVRKHGCRVPLEQRPFRALELLLQHSPAVVTREELQKQLWPEGVFVDFDHGLNKAIGKVRRALNDSAANPRFIQTVGRRGYRFIGSLTSTSNLLPPIASQLTGLPSPTDATEKARPKLRHTQMLPWLGAASIVVSFIAYLLRPTTPKPEVVSVVQLTKSGDAWPLEPMATDGPRLYYQSFGFSDSAANWRLKQVLLNGNEETVIPGTSGRIHSFRIRGLSADDTEFLGLSRVRGETWIPVTLPVVGGSQRRLGSFLADDVAWSHDGRILAFARGHHLSVCNPDGTGERALATLPGDITYLTWSPDDRRLSFTVLTERQTLWEVGADGQGLHEQLRNWPGKPMECCGTWTPNARYFVFRSRRDGASNLWALEEKPAWWRRRSSVPVQLTFGPVNYYQPLSSRNGKTIFAIGALRSGELVRYDAKRKDFVRFQDGRSADQLQFSRDGRWVAYVSVPDRTLWRARSDGSESFQLTFPPMQVDARPHWSPDGKRIAFAAKHPGELLRLYTVSANDGKLEPLPPEASSQATPDWMTEEEALIYGSVPEVDRPASIALYRMDLQTGRRARLVGTDGLYNPLWSPDGKHLAASDAGTQQLFLVDLKSGKRRQLSSPAVYPIWSTDSKYLYYLVHDQEIFRVRVPDGYEEKVLDIPFRLESGSFGVDQDGAPIVLREHGHYDVYSLSLATP
jgi:Tol biopolymer transport system component/DNA-binding winged helix-turn-helix (wHTH) protein